MTAATPEARAFAALGHDARLAIFRLLVRAGDGGLRVGEIGAHLGLAPSTLAHHMAALVEAGLVKQERRGREVVSRADFAQARALGALLLEACCAGIGAPPDAAGAA